MICDFCGKENDCKGFHPKSLPCRCKCKRLSVADNPQVINYYCSKFCREMAKNVIIPIPNLIDSLDS